MLSLVWRCRRVVIEMATTTRLRRPRVATVSSMAETKTKRSRREESAADALADNAANVLFTLPSANIVHGTLSQRPSKAIRSPYVADALVKTEDGIDVPVLAHTPMLDMGGLCVPGAELIMTANDNAATSLDALIAAARRQKSTDDDDGASASSSPEKEPSVPKTTTKTNVSVQLVRSREPESNGNCLIGAHPSLGNKLAFAILELFPSAVLDGVAPPGSRIVSIGKEVTLKLRNRHKMRADFVCDVTDSAQNNNSQHRVVVEVKNVVCADYKASTAPERKDCVFVSHADDYQRTGIFPWGSVKQEFEGRKVVSTRACEVRCVAY